MNWKSLIVVALLAAVFGSCTRRKSDTAYGRGGQTVWIEVPGGRLKGEAYSSAHITTHPMLVVVIHGDLPDPTPSYQNAFAQLVTQGSEAPALPEAVRARLADWQPIPDLVAVGLLRPGYTDNAGDRSDGDMGNAAADNFTPEVIDAITIAVEHLKQRFNARRVILVGHSGGASIAADVLVDIRIQRTRRCWSPAAATPRAHESECDKRAAVRFGEGQREVCNHSTSCRTFALTRSFDLSLASVMMSSCLNLQCGMRTL
jgi:hypothetical protein